MERHAECVDVSCCWWNPHSFVNVFVCVIVFSSMRSSVHGKRQRPSCRSRRINQGARVSDQHPAGPGNNTCTIAYCTYSFSLITTLNDPFSCSALCTQGYQTQVNVNGNYHRCHAPFVHLFTFNMYSLPFHWHWLYHRRDLCFVVLSEA